MSKITNAFTVFTKPWPDKPLEELSAFVAELGFNGVELPVRPGFQVTPENIAKKLPDAVRAFSRQGLTIQSITGTTDNALDEDMIAACGDNGIPMIRVMAKIDPVKGYRQSEKELQGLYLRMVPALERHKVKLGVQNHHGYFVGSAVGLVHLLEPVDSPNVGYVLDPAHCCLAGEPEDLAIGLAWPRLFMVNLKNGIRVRVNGPEAENVEWKVYWTDGRQGFASWPAITKDLTDRGYQGAYCLHAEYSDHDIVENLTRRDLRFAKSLLIF